MTGFHINKYTIWTFSSPCFLCKKNYLKSFNKSIVKYWDKICSYYIYHREIYTFFCMILKWGERECSKRLSWGEVYTVQCTWKFSELLLNLGTHTHPHTHRQSLCWWHLIPSQEGESDINRIFSVYSILERGWQENLSTCIYIHFKVFQQIFCCWWYKSIYLVQG